ncbi:hypothetical protein BC939DRAFT_502213 [Gamsiella multidivaricata]|uniref:uncharacterized protein n=1 Tax=Gamsiella multidivaricata TaxID=101098 RepID=UPI00221FEAEC|nr:uncharacterized protein BC939DRAFT_502213 [Gamsiella multidivaricata]KAI7825270.1 hypothetical protein BC939DRAFT_502213 [Gamsiella multidivaricata]
MRHHRRSVDRVWPPALEVRLARLSMDEGSSLGATHIIPPPPPVSLRQEDEERDQDVPVDHHRLEPIQEGVGAVGGGISEVQGRLGIMRAAAAAATVAASAPASPAERRRNSVLGPLSPSFSFQMEKHLQRLHADPPQIDVQYRKPCKADSPLSGCNYTVFDVHGLDGGRRTTRHQSLSSPSIQTVGGKTEVTAQASLTMVTKDEGNERCDEGFFGHPESSQFQKQLEFLATTGDLPQLTMPSLMKPRMCQHAADGDRGRQGDCNDRNEFDSTEQKTNEEQQLSGPEVFVSLGPPLPYTSSRPSISPSRKNPLSAATSRASSRASSRATSPSRLPSSGAHPIFQQSGYDVQQIQPGLTLERSNKSAQAGQLDNDNDNDFTQVPEISRMCLIDSPVVVSLTPDYAILGDHDRWRSPTLSALASPRSNSRGVSPRRSSPPSDLSQINRMRRQSLNARQGQEELKMAINIPVIETHDEIPLQEIWRTEDEERQDRINEAQGESSTGAGTGAGTGGGSVEEHVARMKGEQHAREEAKLIREAICANERIGAPDNTGS